MTEQFKKEIFTWHTSTILKKEAPDMTKDPSIWKKALTWVDDLPRKKLVTREKPMKEEVRKCKQYPAIQKEKSLQDSGTNGPTIPLKRTPNTKQEEVIPS